MEDRHKQAVDLMLEDLMTKHYDIRLIAMKMGCENELDSIKDQLIQYLQELR